MAVAKRRNHKEISDAQCSEPRAIASLVEADACGAFLPVPCPFPPSKDVPEIRGGDLPGVPEGENDERHQVRGRCEVSKACERSAIARGWDAHVQSVKPALPMCWV